MGRTATTERYTSAEMTDDDARVSRSYDNVFEALDLADPDLLAAKADMSIAFETRIRDLGITQGEAGERAGLTQPDVSQIVRGHLDGFSLERLARCLNALGIDVEIVLHPAKHEPGRIHSTWLRTA